ncbi:hypothetical protein ACN42_g11599 [Penicillium freii]|uniref:Uncharacterized protein n=1 Tax=Penicillium freii TaxID=48697 RepID=A0A101M7W0_PENFR|nr:hypothetical protein ACN42_g11599 [Penicillium freii]
MADSALGRTSFDVAHGVRGRAQATKRASHNSEAIQESPRRNKREYVYQKSKKGIVISSQKTTIVKSKSPETLSNTILFSRHL